VVIGGHLWFHIAVRFGVDARMSTWEHVPVLLDEVVALLRLQPGMRCLDATINGGGHAAALLAAIGPEGRVLGMDRDPTVAAHLQTRFPDELASGRLVFVASSFRELTTALASHGLASIDAALFDLGLSSYHLDASGRGFSFSRAEPLDMRFGTDDAESAAEIIATRDAAALTDIFRTYGEERFASRIARSLVARRRNGPISTSTDLLDAIRQSLPPNLRWRAERHAARVFQALRIAANAELDTIAAALPDAVAALAPGGRIAVISFHSLEDRLIKRFFRAQKEAGVLDIVTRKPVVPGPDEVVRNSRAAPAKLRVAEKKVGSGQ
jgi:16S rRNA (cytosine1402-N4)-methyltransferase